MNDEYLCDGCGGKAVWASGEGWLCDDCLEAELADIERDDGREAAAECRSDWEFIGKALA